MRKVGVRDIVLFLVVDHEGVFSLVVFVSFFFSFSLFFSLFFFVVVVVGTVITIVTVRKDDATFLANTR